MTDYIENLKICYKRFYEGYYKIKTDIMLRSTCYLCIEALPTDEEYMEMRDNGETVRFHPECLEHKVEKRIKAVEKIIANLRNN